MKYLRTYEDVKEPQIGDYVICCETDIVIEIVDFINNNIGKILDINNPDKYGFFEDFPYIIKYENVPSEISAYFYNDVINEEGITAMNRSEILFYSSNYNEAKKMLTVVKNSNKYNL